MTAWECPICDWAIDADDITSAVHAHGTIAHPSTLPGGMTTRDRLVLIPALAREVRLTVRHRNPSAWESDRGVAASRAPKLPINAGALEVLAPEDGDQPDRPLTMLVECSRIVWEALDLQARQEYPQPDGDPSYRGECRWLLSVWGVAQVCLDLCDIAWIEDSTRTITAQLAAVASMTAEARYACPDCGQPMHLGEDDWVICETGKHQHPGPVRLRDQWRRRPAMTTADLAAELRIDPHRIRVWRDRGKIEPIRIVGGKSWYLPWDVVCLLHPDMTAIVEAGEVA